MRFLARCVRGLEWVAADEIATALAPSRIRMRSREIRFDLPEPGPALLALRTVDDVFAEVGRLDGVGHTKDVPPVLAGRVAELDWAEAVDCRRQVRDLPARPLFDVVVSLEGRRNFNRYTLEDEVGALLAPRLRGRFVSRTQDAGRAAETDLTVRLLVQGQGATVALRLADRPLHRRPYKQDAGPGSLHPPLAAALVRMAVAGDGPVVVADPFCGDGTIPIETLLAHPEARVLASDLDPARLANTQANAQRATRRHATAEHAGAELTTGELTGAEHAIATHADAEHAMTKHAEVERAMTRLALVRADAGLPPWGRDRIDVVVSNPPWNVAVEAGGSLSGSLERFWSALAECAGRHVCLIADADLDAPGRLRAAGLTLFPHVQRVRVAGRISDLVFAAPGAVPPELPPGLAGWLDRALGAGLVGTDDSF